ncbi:hypothetical protein BIV60_22315 [Bacillus sp. MUM 116]|nr:hypothetical protein BIV60_22315 [Bacillus sp. MUM 116]
MSASGIAQAKPAERLFFNLLDGLACDFEGQDACAGQFSKPNFLSYLIKKEPLEWFKVQGLLLISAAYRHSLPFRLNV